MCRPSGAFPQKPSGRCWRSSGWRGSGGKKVCHYSLGMKQRLGIATALLGYPKLLILDEPTNGLDPAGIQEMRELIRDLPSRFGMTVVVSSHLLSEIDQMADTVGIIREGVLVFQDTLAALHGRSRHHLALRTTNNALAAQVLREKGIGWTEEGGTIWSCPFSRTSRRPGCAGLWWRDAWGWSAWRSGRRAWRTSSWSSQGERK